MKMPKGYISWKNELVDQIVDKQKDWSIEEWVEKSGLYPTTVYNLMYRITKNPQMRTVFLLARAANAVGILETSLKRAA